MVNKSDYKHQWVYKHKPDGCKCYDCGLEYGTFSDLSLPNWLWEEINPSIHKCSGILCPNCIASRLDYLGLWYSFCSDSIFFQSYLYIKIRRFIWDNITSRIRFKYWEIFYKNKVVDK